MNVKRIFAVVLSLLLIVNLTACGSTNPSSSTESKPTQLDYANEVEFEKALNSGADTNGTIIQFYADSIHPDSAVGFNIWSGEHLNFISDKNPGIKEGQAVIAKVETVTKNLGSWFITYDVIEVKDGGKAAPALEKKDLVLKDSGYTVEQHDSYCYITYAVEIYNPNEDFVVEYPEIKIVCKAEDGSILESDEQTLCYICPKETIKYASFSYCEHGIPETIEISIDSDDSFYEIMNNDYVPSSSFTFSNISVFDDSAEVSANVTNNSNKDVSLAISVVYIKNGHVIGGETSYEDVDSQKTEAVMLDGVDYINDYDSIQIYACEW